MTYRIAVVDLCAASRHQVMALAMLDLHADVQWLNDPADYSRVYPAGPGPDIAMIGLDEEPEAALVMAQHIVSRTPSCGLIGYASKPSPELMMQAMASEVRRFLTYPFDAAELSKAIEAVYKPPVAMSDAEDGAAFAQPARVALALPPAVVAPPKGQVIALFSAKGGVGTTTVAVNLACALRPRSVLLIDANISYGNLGMFLDTHTSRSMIDIDSESDELSFDTISRVFLTHQQTGIKMLLAPPKPEQAEEITKGHLRAIVDAVRPHFDYIIVDTWPSYDDRVLAVLDAANRIIMPVGPDYPALKNAGAFLRVAGLLEYPREKIVPVLMRADTVRQEHIENAEKYLKRTLEHKIVSDGLRVTQSVNKGIPFVLSEPSALVSRNIIDLARLIDGRTQEFVSAPVVFAQPFIGVVKRIFTRRVA